MCGGEGEGKVAEQQTGALGNPRSSFSSSSSSLCIRWGFDKISTLVNDVQRVWLVTSRLGTGKAVTFFGAFFNNFFTGFELSVFDTFFD